MSWLLCGKCGNLYLDRRLHNALHHRKRTFASLDGKTRQKVVRRYGDYLSTGDAWYTAIAHRLESYICGEPA